jgi:hypothetical protein
VTAIRVRWGDAEEARARAEAEEMTSAILAKARDPRRAMEPSDVGQYLGGFLSAFALWRPSAHYLPDRWAGAGRGVWVIEGLEPWWPRPGRPVVPQEEIGREHLGRLNFLIRETFAEACRLGEVERLTRKRGRELETLLARCGLGAYRWR